jgi:hypothetical protein
MVRVRVRVRVMVRVRTQIRTRMEDYDADSSVLLATPSSVFGCVDVCGFQCVSRVRSNVEPTMAGTVTYQHPQSKPLVAHCQIAVGLSANGNLEQTRERPRFRT